MTDLISQYQAAAAYIRQQSPYQPKIGIVLGSGLGQLADEVENPTVLSYTDIPHFPPPGVAGHAGRLLLGTLAGQTLLVMQGRFHFYEGHSMQTVTLPIRVMQSLGIETLVVSNAAGGLNPDFEVGDLMLITDHINLTGLSGHNPLIGPNLDALGPRFVDMVSTYDQGLQMLARTVARQLGLTLREGVYVNVSGPSYETPAEIRFLRLIGGDAVGMSTTPEVVVARHGGMRVLGLSGITNIAITDPRSNQQTTHEEVLRGADQMGPNLVKLVRALLLAM